MSAKVRKGRLRHGESENVTAALAGAVLPVHSPPG
jgi:hypothetical protein